MKYLLHYGCVGLVICCLNLSLAEAQNLLEDKAAQQTSLEALNHIYGWEFAQAKQKIETLKPKYGNHSVYYLLQALVLYWQYIPLEKTHPQYQRYAQLLNRCSQLAEARLKRNKNNNARKDVEALFFKLMPNGLQALGEIETGSLRRAVGYARRAYSAIKKGFKLKEQFSEFYFSTGLYRYYAKQFPKTRPLVKPFMIFFPAGNKQAGLRHLQTASQKALYTKYEALVFLADIYLRYESNQYLASLAFAQLSQLFPKNPFFVLKYAECLVHLGRYYEAQNLFSKFENFQPPMYQIGKRVLQGLIAEKLQKNPTLARKLYGQAINIKGFDQRYSRDFRALAKAGLARIISTKKDKASRKVARELYKQARKHTEYEWLKKDIRKALKRL